MHEKAYSDKLTADEIINSEWDFYNDDAYLGVRTFTKDGNVHPSQF